MPRTPGFLTAMTAVVAFAVAPVAASEPDADTVVARVNGEEITLGHMIVAYGSLPPQYRQIPADQLFDALREQLIQQSALVQARTGDVPRAVELTLENERRELLAADMLESVMRDAATDEEIQAVYDKRFADGKGGQEYNAAHILVDTEEEAQALKEQLDEGADFAKLAEAESSDVSSANGGDLGWFREGEMVPEFQDGVESLEPGEVSDPVQSQFGWHIIRLNDKREADAPPLDAVRDEIADQLRRAAVEARIEELTAGAEVERPEIEGFDPDVLNKSELLGD